MAILTDSSVIGFMLALCRIGAALAVAPAFSRREVPVRVRIVTAAAIAFVAAPANAARAEGIHGAIGISVAATGEVMVGLLFGFAAHLLFAAVRMSGEFIGRQIGLGLAAMADPENGGQVSVCGELMSTIGLLILLASDGHLVMLLLLVKSCPIAPPALPALARSMPPMGVHLDRAFGAALSLAAPVLIVSFLTSVVLALLARAAPQANILLVGFPLKLGAGLAALAFFMPLMGWCLVRLVNRMGPDLQAFLAGG